jgi:lipid A 4'-phosphatase
MGRRWVLSAIAVGVVAGLLFAIFPQLDLAIPGWFFDPVRGNFPLAITWFPNLLRTIGHWTTWLIVLAAGGSLLAKILFPRTKALLSPRIALFLVCSFAIGPGLIVNGILKPTWARPRPVFVQQFGKQQTFEPWWKPGGDCRSNCSFVSGDTAEAFWLLAPASITPPSIRPVAEIAVVGFATALGSLRVVFGRHFPTDVIFAGVIMVIVVAACRRVFLRMDDSKIERSLERIGDSLRRLFARWFNWLRAASQRKSRDGRSDPHQSDEKKRKEHASRGEVLGDTDGIVFFGLDMIAQPLDRGIEELDRED